MAGSDPPKVPEVPGTREDEWDDDRPTDIKVPDVPSSAHIRLVPLASADQTDEYPLLIPRDLPPDEILPSFLEANLEVMNGPDTVGSYDVRRVRTTIGRGQGAVIRVHDTTMSKVHASIVFNGSEFRIRDEKSTNGTFLNGSAVSEYAIRDGDKLLVGGTLFTFRVGGRRET